MVSIRHPPGRARVFIPPCALRAGEVAGAGIRWTDRIQSQSGDWSGSVFDLFTRVSAGLLRGLRVPFRLQGMARQDETPAHDAVREALANCLVNADYQQAQGVVGEY